MVLLAKRELEDAEKEYESKEVKSSSCPMTDCSWIPMPGRQANSVYLPCHLTSTDSCLERTYSNSIPSESTPGIRIECAAVSLGRPEREELPGLARLEELEIQGRALESIPACTSHGLHSLRQLALVSSTDLWVLRVEQILEDQEIWPLGPPHLAPTEGQRPLATYSHPSSHRPWQSAVLVWCQSPANHL